MGSVHDTLAPTSVDSTRISRGGPGGSLHSLRYLAGKHVNWHDVCAATTARPHAHLIAGGEVCVETTIVHTLGSQAYDMELQGVGTEGGSCGYRLLYERSLKGTP